jgi:serine/alanine adding enzyme
MLTIVECPDPATEWDDYVYRHPQAGVYHQLGWQRAIAGTFGHQGHFLLATDDGEVKGILPLFLMESRIFGRYLVSLPFINSAGLVADDRQAEEMLINKAIELSKQHKVDYLELRNNRKLEHSNLVTSDHKIDFVLPLTPNPDVIWQERLHENVRNKVRKALKHNLTVHSGNDPDYVKEFYRIFSRNMRDLGTPVYPRKFFLNILKEFPDQVKIFLVRGRDEVIGGKLVLLFKDTMYFIYHSSLRKYAHFAPNNLLYWAAIEYACNNGYRFCNMGRSTVNSGAFHFKKQFGGEISPLYWQYFLNKARTIPNLTLANPRFSLAITIWKRLPLVLTRMLGPMIARQIP